MYKTQSVISPSHDASQPIPLAVKVLSGGLTGAIGSAISNPIDVVRTRLQAHISYYLYTTYTIDRHTHTHARTHARTHTHTHTVYDAS